jgi:hypothetical protein
MGIIPGSPDDCLSTMTEAISSPVARSDVCPISKFKTLPRASATIKGFDVMRMIRKQHCLMFEQRMAEEVRFVNRLFLLLHQSLIFR